MYRRVSLIILLCVTRTLAQPAPPPGEADKLFEKGRLLAKEGKFAEACDAFQKSFDVDHATGTELNLGDCHEQLGHFRKAWELYTSAAEEYERAGNTARSKFARERATAVAAKLGTIVVEVPQPQPMGLAITIAGRVVQPAGQIRELVEPGKIEITASAPDRQGFVDVKQVEAGQTVTVELPTLAQQGARVVEHVEPVLERRHSRVVLAWSLGGVAGASAIAGVAFTLIARSKYNSAADDTAHCTHVPGGVTCDAIGRSEISNAQHLADAGTGFAIGTALFAGVAAAIYFTAPRDAVTVTPTATAQSVGLAIGGRF